VNKRSIKEKFSVIIQRLKYEDSYPSETPKADSVVFLMVGKKWLLVYGEIVENGTHLFIPVVIIPSKVYMYVALFGYPTMIKKITDTKY
jgi:hypothetical protein